MQDTTEKLLAKYTKKAAKAREQYKMPMYFYYLSKLHNLKEVTGFISSELKHWYNFCNPNKRNEVDNFPEIIVLCGSTRFHKIFDRMNYEFTMQGKIVLSIGTVTSSDLDLNISNKEKIMLDELHKRKIDLADTVYVINHEQYIGESTRSEIEYAKNLNKPIRYFYDEMMQDKADRDLAEWDEQRSQTREYCGGDL